MFWLIYLLTKIIKKWDVDSLPFFVYDFLIFLKMIVLLFCGTMTKNFDLFQRPLKSSFLMRFKLMLLKYESGMVCQFRLDGIADVNNI